MRAKWKVIGLRETRDKRPLVRDQTGTPHEYDEVFLVAAHDSMGIGSSIRASWKVLVLNYNRCETRDCPEFHVGHRLVCCCRCPLNHGLWPKKLTLEVVVTPAPVQIHTQQPSICHIWNYHYTSTRVIFSSSRQLFRAMFRSLSVDFSIRKLL